MVNRDRVALTVGESPPAMSISWAPPIAPVDSGYVVFFAEFDPDDENDRTPTRPVCLHCLLADGDEQLRRGLDLARRFGGQVDYDVEGGAWFVVSAGPGRARRRC